MFGLSFARVDVCSKEKGKWDAPWNSGSIHGRRRGNATVRFTVLQSSFLRPLQDSMITPKNLQLPLDRRQDKAADCRWKIQRTTR
jgi:hypothetical protein